jgi:hypothetical protein
MASNFFLFCHGDGYDKVTTNKCGHVLTQHELNGTRQGRSNIEPGIQKLEANGTPTYVVCIKDVLIGINEAHVVYFG